MKVIVFFVPRCSHRVSGSPSHPTMEAHHLSIRFGAGWLHSRPHAPAQSEAHMPEDVTRS